MSLSHATQLWRQQVAQRRIRDDNVAAREAALRAQAKPPAAAGLTMSLCSSRTEICRSSFCTRTFCPVAGSNTKRLSLVMGDTMTMGWARTQSCNSARTTALMGV